jgi:hypothetical protein
MMPSANPAQKLPFSHQKPVSANAQSTGNEFIMTKKNLSFLPSGLKRPDLSKKNLMRKKSVF